MRTIWTGLAYLLFLVPLSAGTLQVGPGGPFTDIQSAIDAGASGDVILVEPGTYPGFVLVGKGLTIKADTADFMVSGDVRLLAVPAGQRAAIKGMQVLGALMQAEFCQGEVILEKISMGVSTSSLVQFEVTGCSNLSLSDVTLTRRSSRPTWPTPNSGLFVDQSSRVSMHNLTLTNLPLEIGNQSSVYLSGSRLHGWDGRDGAGCLGDPDGGKGGYAVRVNQSTFLATGGPGHLIQGGDGGIGSSTAPCLGSGGNGGAGIQETNSTVTLSQGLAVLGGQGGSGGRSDGLNGAVVQGVADQTQFLPFLDLSPDLERGGQVTLDLDADSPGGSPLTALLIFSGAGAFVPLGNFGGPPLLVHLGSPAKILGGTTNGQGDLTLSFAMINDPLLEGFPLHVQAAVLDPQGGNVLSNTVVRVID